MTTLNDDITLFNPLYDFAAGNVDNGLRSQLHCPRFENDTNELLCLASWHFLLHSLTHKRESVVTCLVPNGQESDGAEKVIPLISEVDEGFIFAQMVSSLWAQCDKAPVDLTDLRYKELRDHFACHAIYQAGANRRSVKEVEIALIRLQDGWLVDYASALYSEDYVAKIVNLWLAISAQVFNGNNLAIADIRLVSGEVKIESRAELEGPSQSIQGNLLTQFEQVVETFSNKIAVKNREDSLTYQALDELSDHYAAVLIDNGVAGGDCVGVAFERNLKMIVAQLAVLKAGAVFVPMDAEQPAARLSAIVEDADINCIFTENACIENLAAAVTGPGLLSYEKHLIGNRKRYIADTARICQDDIAYVIFTSGSTGRPKGVRVSHGNLSNFVRHIDTKLHPIEVGTQFAPFTFDASVAEIHVTLLHGGTLLVLSKELIDDPEALQRYMNEEDVTFAAFPPQYARHLSPEKLPSLKILLTAGSAPDRTLIQKWQPHLRYVNAYGPTETTILSTAWEADRIPAEHEPIAMGFPILNTSVRVINRFGQVLPDGVVGELLIGGAGVAHGYLKQEQLSAARFIEMDNKRWYRSGDLSCFNPNDGLVFVGRVDDQVKIRGHRLEPGEVESAIRGIEGIDAVAAAITKINGENQLVVFCQGEQLEEAEIRDKMHRVLPAWAVPNRIHWLASLPMTVNGKIDYKKLKLQLSQFEETKEGEETQEGEEMQEGEEIQEEHEAAFASRLEQQVADIWRQVLKSQQVTRNDNFIHLGGDSLTALVVSSSLRNLGFAVSSSKLLAHPVLSEFCQLLETQAVQTVQNYSVWQGQATLNPIQAWFFYLDLKQPHAFCQSLVFDCQRPLDLQRFEKALLQLIAYHDQLRVAFPGFSDRRSLAEIRQVIEGLLTNWPGIIEKTVVNSELERETDSLRQSLAAQIDIEQAPLFRLAVLQAQGFSRVVWVFHHLLMDTISHSILLEDLYLLYSEDADANKVLAGKTAQYAVWSEKLVDHINRHAERKLLQWQPVLAVSKRAQALGRLNSGHANIELNTHSIGFSRDLTSRLLQKAPACYRQSAEELILAASCLALSRTFSVSEFGIDVEWHGRDESFLENLALDRSVGWFTSVHPLFMKLDGFIKGDCERDIGGFLIALKEQRAAIPERGRDFYGLRYLCRNEKVNEAFKDYVQPEVLFNFSGVVQRRQGAWSTVPVTAIEMGCENTNPYKLSIESSIRDECLEIGLYLNDRIWPAEVRQQLQEALRQAVEQIVAHCCNSAHRRWTPADFPLLALSQTEADSIPLQAVSAFPLTDMQATMLRHEQTYQVWMHYELSRPFSQRAFSEAVADWIDHNECLRTYIHTWEDEKSAQVVLAEHQVTVEVEKSKPEQRLPAAQAYIEAGRHRPVTVRRRPPFSIKVVHSGETAFSVVLSIHHVIHDGWSIELLMDSLFNFYRKHLGEKVVLPGRPVSTMKDVVLEQMRISRAPAWNDYWSSVRWAEHYCQLPETLYDKSSGAAAEVELYLGALSERTVSGLRQRAQKTGITVNSLLLTGYVLLLRYLGGCHQVRCGVIQSGRSETVAGVDKIVGCCVNTLPLIVDFSQDQSLASIIDHVNALMLTMRDSAAFPLSRIYQNAKDKLSGAMFDCLFNIESSGYGNNGENSDSHSYNFTAGKGYTLKGGYESTNYAFIFGLIEKQTGSHIDDRSYGLRIGFDKSKYGRETVEHWAGIYENILTLIAADDQAAWRDVQPLPASDKERIATWNQTRTPYPAEVCIGRHFDEVVKRVPDRFAVKFKDIALTYAELDERTDKLARLLAARGAGPEVIVGLVAERSLEMVIGILAVIRAGAAYVPIDPKYPQDRVRHMVEDVACKVVLYQNRAFDGVVPADLAVEAIFLDQLDSCTVNDLDKIDTASHHTRQLAYVMYTSGSTGKPKGVMIEQRSIVRLIKNSKDIEFSDRDTIMITSAPGFDVTTFEMWSALLNGLTLVVIDEDTLLNPELLAHEIRGKNVSLLWLVAPLFNQLIQEKKDLFRGVKRLMIGGDALSPYHIRLAQQHTPELQIINGYGPTENTSFSTYHFLSEDDSEIIPIGRPITNSTAYVVNRDGQLLPAGVKGELYVGGHGVARGYFNREVLTAEKFVENRFFEDDGKLYRTGDLVSWRDNGLIDFHGRIDFQIKIRGFRVELGEIETVILRRSSVSQALVLARDLGPQKQLLAYIVPENAEAMSSADRKAYVADLRAALEGDLPDYMVPDVILVLKSMPLNANGKIDRARLPNPDELKLEDCKFSAPENAAEQTLYKVWQEVLGHSRFGVTDSFYNVGGDSILAIQIVSRAARQGFVLTTRTLMEHNTIRALVRAAGPSATDANTPATAQEIIESKPVVGEQRLLPIQFKLIQDDSTSLHHYNQAGIISLPGKVSLRHLVNALAAIINRHDVFRLVFRASPMGWRATYQAQDKDQILAKVERLLTVVEKNKVEKNKVEETAPSTRENGHSEIALFNDLQASLDIGRGDLFRFALLQGEEVKGEQDRLFWVIHHLVVDAVSWRIIMDDLEHLLSLEAEQCFSHRCSNTASYQEWAVYLYEYAYSESLLAEKDFWLAQIQPACDRLTFVIAAMAPFREHTTVQQTFELNREETWALLFDVNEAYETNTTDLLLTALLLAMRIAAGVRNLRIDLEGHGREPLAADIDLSQTVGWFTTLYPLLFKDIQEDIGRQIQNVKGLLRSVPNNGIGFGLLSYITQEEEILDTFCRMGSKTSQVLFNYLGIMDRGVMDRRGGATELEFTMGGTGSTVSGQRLRSHELRINSYVKNGCLKCVVDYSEEQFSFKTVKALGEHYLNSIRDVIGHCRCDRGKLSPRQFSLARLSRSDIDYLNDHVTDMQDVYPATPMQEGLALYSLREPASGAYHTQLRILLENVDSDILYNSWKTLARRHDILRTAFFDLQQEHLMQVVVRDVDIPWQEIADRDTVESEKAFSERSKKAFSERSKKTICKLFDRHRLEPFDMQKAPLWRLLLVRYSDRRAELSWTHHHALLDGWSIAHLLGELLSVYETLSKGMPPAGNEPVQFRDYVAWLQTQDRKRAQLYWTTKLTAVNGPTRLHQINEAKPHERHVTQAARVKSLDETLTRNLLNVAREADVTLSVIVQTAWGLLLSKYSGEKKVLFGCSVSGRPPLLQGVEAIAGLFINSLPVVLSLPGEALLHDVFKQVMATQLANEEHGYVSLADIQQWSGLPTGELPFESLLVVENYPLDASAFDTENEYLPKVLSVKGIENNNLPLNIVVYPGRTLEIKVAYDTSKFRECQIDKILERMELLLSQFSTGMNGTVSSYQLVDSAETKNISISWNATACELPAGKSVYDIFTENLSSRSNGQVAVVCKEERLTFEALNEKVKALSNGLVRQGIKKGDFVAVSLDKDTAFIVAILSLLKIGAAYVPVALDCPKARREFIIKDAGIQHTLTHSALLDKVSCDVSQTVICLDRYSAEAGDEAGGCEVSANDTAYVIYTSGTTGQPKGVKISHKNIINFCTWCKQARVVVAGDTITQFAPFTFDASAGEIFSALLNGAELHLLTDDIIHNHRKLIDYLHRCSINFSAFPPSYLEHLPIAQLPQGMTVLTAGSAPGLELVKKLSTRVRYINGYGPTETTVISTAWEYNEADVAAGRLPIGKPIANTRVYVLDQYRQLCPPGIVGEICIGGEGVSQGYINRDELNQACFITDAWGSSGTLYRTGDLGRWLDNGDIEFVGRRDNQIKIRGFRVELSEIESQLTALEAVKSAVVSAVGEDADKQIFAWIISAQPQLLQSDHQAGLAARIKNAMKDSLPHYMVPQAVVVVEGFPLTANGKVDVKALPYPDADSLTEDDFVAPTTERERQLVSLWAKTLKLDPEKISVNADFFELGGHSLLATRLCNAIAGHFDIEIPVSALFENPTVASLASCFDRLMAPYPDRLNQRALPPITASSGQEERPLSYSQRRLWFITQLDETSAAYNMAGGVRLCGQLNVEALQETLNTIVNRHEVLRSNFINKDGQPVQLVNETANFPLLIESVDSSALTGIDPLIKEHLAEESNRAFDLARDSLARGRLLALGRDEYVLIITMHHIVSDGWSMGIFLKEMSAIYQALAGNSEPALPALLIQYSDYARWQLHCLKDEILAQHLGYWRAQLKGLPSVHNMPLDNARSAEQSYRGAQYNTLMSAELTDRARGFARKHHASLFMVIYAAFSGFLSRYSGESDIVLGTPIANRDQREVADLIGFFANTLILRLNLDNDPSFRAIIDQSRRITTEAYEHQLLPFDVLVEDLQPERSLSYNPLFQIMISMINIDEINEFQLPGLSLSTLDNATQATAQFDLMLDIVDSDKQIALNWNYATDLFQADTIERLSRHFLSFIEDAVSHPDKTLSDIRFLSPSEQRRLLVDFNDTDRPELITRGWPELFDEKVTNVAGEQVVAICGSESLTFKALDERSLAVARALQETGLSTGAIVALLDHRGLDLLVMMVGVIRCGAAYLPLDPTHPTQRWLDILQEAEPDLLITGNELVIEKRWLSRKWRKEKITTLPPLETTGCDSGIHLQYPNLHDTAYVIYTSGSTGRPKGVMIEHRGMINNMLAKFEPLALTEKDVIAQTASQCFDISVWQFLIAPVLGAKVVIIPNEVTRDPETLLRTIVAEGVTVWEPVPSVMHAILPMQVEFDKLRWVIPTGEALTEALVKRWFEQYPGIPLMNAYGPAECSDDVSLEKIEASTDRVLIGSPVANARLHVVDNYRQLVPVGIVGELAVSGAVVGKGYLNAPDMTAKVFKENPFAQNDQDKKLYLTGDLVRRLADGRLQYIGRKDFQVKIRGFRIELGEIESRINTCPGLDDSIAVALEGPDGEKLLVAYAIKDKRHSGPYPTPNDLREFLKNSLPDYMVPSAFVLLDEYPLTPNGKVDRKALPAPEFNQQENREYVAPVGHLEETLAGIWSDVLQVVNVGRNDDYFELGGSSLLLVKIITEARKQALNITVNDIYQKRSVKACCEHLQSAGQELYPWLEERGLDYRLFETEKGAAADSVRICIIEKSAHGQLCDIKVLVNRNKTGDLPDYIIFSDQPAAVLASLEEQGFHYLTEGAGVVDRDIDDIAALNLALERGLYQGLPAETFAITPIQRQMLGWKDRLVKNTFSIKGFYSDDELCQCFLKVQNEQDMLRSRFDKRAVCWQLYPPLELPLTPIIDLRRREAGAQAALMEMVMKNLVVAITKSPILYLACWVRLSDTEQKLCLASDHIIADGLAFNALTSRLEMYLSGEHKALGRSYRQYVAALYDNINEKNARALKDIFDIEELKGAQKKTSRTLRARRRAPVKVLNLKFSAAQTSVMEHAFSVFKDIVSALLESGTFSMTLNYHGRQLLGHNDFDQVGLFLDKVPFVITASTGFENVNRVVTLMAEKGISFMGIQQQRLLGVTGLLPGMESEILFNFVGEETPENLSNLVGKEDVCNLQGFYGILFEVYTVEQEIYTRVVYRGDGGSDKKLKQKFKAHVVQGKGSGSGATVAAGSDPAIEVKNVKKRYGEYEAVKGISFTVGKGICYGILGPNGAGKTSLLGMMEGITSISEGEISILGMDVKSQVTRIQPHLGVQLQHSNYFDFLSVKQLLKFYQELRSANGRSASGYSIDELLERVSLADKKEAKVEELSGGQKQRLSMVIALLEDPEVLFLDEPTSALDPHNRRNTWEFIEELKKAGDKTIVLTTHYMEEAERLCDELLIMHEGRVISQGSPRQLIAEMSVYHDMVLELSESAGLEQYLKTCAQVLECDWDREEECIRIKVSEINTIIRKIVDYCAGNNIEIRRFDIKRPNLEDVFMHRTGKELKA